MSRTAGSAAMTGMPRHTSRLLGRWSWGLLALLAAHDLTHLLDDGLDTRPGELAVVATPQWIALVGVMALVLHGDRARSAAAALVLGLGATIGFAAIHLLPFSLAAYADLEPSRMSWLLAWVPAATGLVVAGLALAELRNVRGVRARDGDDAGRRAVTRPDAA